MAICTRRKTQVVTAALALSALASLQYWSIVATVKSNKAILPLDPLSTAYPPPPGGKYCDVHDFRSYINTTDEREFQCVLSTTSPNVRVCVYPNDVDIYVSASIRGKGRWENTITRSIISALSRHPEAVFIDIGANVGIHSLVVAANHGFVVAVEPKWSSIQRLHKSVILNQFTGNFILVKNAISDIRGDVTLYSDDVNQGGSSIRYVLPHRETVQSIIMDDLLDVFQATEAIIKIDIQGSEAKALLNSTQFFAYVNVHAIYMEWEEMANFLRSKDSKDRTRVLNMVAYLRSLGFIPYSAEDTRPVEKGSTRLRNKDMRLWPINIVWQKNNFKK